MVQICRPASSITLKILQGRLDEAVIESVHEKRIVCLQVSVIDTIWQM